MALALVVDNNDPVTSRPATPPEPPVTAQMAIESARSRLPRRAVVVWTDAEGDVTVSWGGLDKAEALELAETGARLLGYE